MLNLFTISLGFLLLTTGLSFGQEYIFDYENQTIVTLNEELRKRRAELYRIQTDTFLTDRINGSIVMTNSRIQLSGDNTTPGNAKYYGTNLTGTKGWNELNTTNIGIVNITQYNDTRYKIGASNITGNGTVTVTGVGFRASIIRFFGASILNSVAGYGAGIGVTDGTNQYTIFSTNNLTGNWTSNLASSLIVITGNGAFTNYNVTSVNNDGFNYTVTGFPAVATVTVVWEACR